MIRLSVLDQSPIRKGGTAGQAVAETLELAMLCDRLGYHRYWLAEHHNTPSLAGSSPEILVARIAGLTNRLRVGSGGIMLTHYSPLKVAESFRMLEALYPGRIDLGIGRAPGADRRTAEALSAGPGALGIEHYPYQLGNLLKYIANADDAQTNGVQAQPVGSATPQLWMLGSSDASAAFASHFGLPFSYAHFINADGGERVMSAYRTSFNPSPHAAVPSGSVGVFAICADTDEEARFEAASRDLYSLKQRTGEPIAIPAPEEAIAYPYTEAEIQIVAMNRHRTVAGNPITVRDRLLEIAARYAVEELVVVTITYGFEARKRSYELLAESFALQAALP